MAPLGFTRSSYIFKAASLAFSKLAMPFSPSKISSSNGIVAKQAGLLHRVMEESTHQQATSLPSPSGIMQAWSRVQPQTRQTPEM